MAKTKTGVNLYINGTKHNASPIPESGDRYNISDVVNPGDTFTIQESYAYDDLSESGKSVLQTLTLDFKTVLTPAQTSIPALYWPNVYKSSEWPLFTTTKDYFCLYSSDHSQALNAGVYWGEMDTPEFDGFVEGGAIITGTDSQETPWLIKSTPAISGVADSYFLYFHGFTGASIGSVPIQETGLITTSGGAAPHLCTWTDRGRPLGLGATEQHTGYCRVFGPPERLIAHHLINGGGVANGSAVSVSTDGGLSFSRIHTTFGGSFSTAEYRYLRLQDCPFEYNGINFGFFLMVSNADTTKSRTVVAEFGDEYSSVNIIDTVCESTSTRNLVLYIESGIAYLYHKGGGSANNDTTHPFKMYKYKLSNLDNYISVFTLYRKDTVDFMGIGAVQNTTDIFFEGTPQENIGVNIWSIVNNFMIALNSASLLGKMVAIYPMVGGSIAGHGVNLINARTNQVTWKGSWLHTETGAKPVEGTSAFGNTGIVPSVTGALTHLSIYSREDIVYSAMYGQDDAGTSNTGSTGPSLYLFLSAKRPDGKAHAINSGPVDIPATVSNAQGFYIVSKQSPTLTKLFKNGVTLGSAVDTGSDSPSGELCIGARGKVYAPGDPQVISTSYSNRELAFVSFGTALSDIEQSTFYDLVQDLQVALKREV